MDSITKLTDRSFDFRDRNKERSIKKILGMMNKHRITLADLEHFEEPSTRDKFNIKRQIGKNKEKAAASLKKARGVRQQKAKENKTA